jgi:hypothetical protein
MIEALKIIVSAWSVALIVLFFIFFTAETPSPEFATARAHTMIELLTGSITATGWLWFRHQEKRKRPI